ncbi:UDP-N-acetylmuramate:L-alanyl-gamma-D-glutamyl-meso-diaminopimelate ligase [Aestuariirhabdus litorea]|uniref:UDP-N-acetylmuramate--L-alanyl-gamma-D-glutamyl-meso-2,6-diaminoheptandioate ligase n=1 Tax=Aestuariirhabdus litorea TaxID=2528527 RepID=A0A3P3VLR0_9GAMM|nr:UDP-N-acetylmuramate:L-alanyl-gamma-D-glutamyl-meso-diaminopimelate ligase [Aestuariirhabdus litorea]RRJ83560.1 UDP-N-acetylmuramate:L-alanyl-gamma-D-glutamyl-meso-diaminopimelate ligase [Aestuariirhabdus litorea]RWW96781.1 UDP-N-acetylmuramate:L-alanyl-gamma-D-glutamyl-meso-diaminopimelate ligase [Endozoicomonadaceae bacterium GTF-13]
MHIHILGICGTFMGSLAVLAKSLGHRVTGSDQNVYPPMSTQLEAHGIELVEGYDPAQLEPAPDLVVVGNAMSRGNPAVEYLLDKGLPYRSGPQWLAEQVLQGRWVLAVAGTHGKTSTSSMLAWILEYAGMAPGFLIGGVPGNFGVSARLGETPFFVIEADEYDSAFFDKRSKFVHYQPRTAILNNLEFDHADIFPDLAAIQRQFHHLVRTIPSSGLVIFPAGDEALQGVLAEGCWSEQQPLSLTDADATWFARPLAADGSRFEVCHQGQRVAEVSWSLLGDHNRANALAAIAAARHVGVTPAVAAEALGSFAGIKRRLELIADCGGVRVYDDFAHHPTAIETTLRGLRARVGQEGRILAVIEPRSNTMRMGVHRPKLAPATACADRVYWFQPAGVDWALEEVVAQSPVEADVESSVEQLVERLLLESRAGDHILVMSNGGFGGLHLKLKQALEERYPQHEH